jgi:hypothetical protein
LLTYTPSPPSPRPHSHAAADNSAHRSAEAATTGRSTPLSPTLTAGTGELLAELRGLCERLPMPQPGWHPYVAQIAACRSDFEHALALAAANPAALEQVADLIEGETEAGFDRTSSPELTSAWRRLETLPLPSGHHPYLDEIVPALEAHRLLLVALSRTAL